MIPATPRQISYLKYLSWDKYQMVCITSRWTLQWFIENVLARAALGQNKKMSEMTNTDVQSCIDYLNYRPVQVGAVINHYRFGFPLETPALDNK